MRHRIGWIACSILLLGLTGCQSDIPTDAPDVTTLTNPSMSVVGACNSYQTGRPYMRCDSTFYVGLKNSPVQPTPGELSKVQGRVNEWRSAVFNGDFGIPRMEYTTNQNLMDIEVRFDSTGLAAGQWCGSGFSDGPGGMIGVISLGIVCGTGGSTPVTLEYLVLHELSELGVTGFTGSPSSLDEVNALCPSIDQKPNGFRPQTPCEWERQRVLDLANVRPNSVNWNSFLVDDLKLSTPSSSIVVGDTIDVNLVTIRRAYAFEQDPELGTVLASSPDTVVHPTSAWTKTGPANWIGGQPSGTDRSGTLVATGAGTIKVITTASSGSAVVYPWPTDTIAIAVSPPGPPPVASVTVSPFSVVLSSSNPSQLLTATARDAQGNPIPGTSFNWSKNSPWIFLSGTGNTRTVTGCRDGPLPLSATVTATAVGTSISGSTRVRVNGDYPYYC